MERELRMVQIGKEKFGAVCFLITRSVIETRCGAQGHLEVGCFFMKEEECIKAAANHKIGDTVSVLRSHYR